MDEILKYLKDYLHIDPVTVLIVIASGFFVKRFLSGSKWFHDQRTDEALKTLIVSFVVGFTYLFLIETPKALWAQYFLSYFVATSLYEVLIRPLVKFIQKRIEVLTGTKDSPVSEPKPADKTDGDLDDGSKPPEEERPDKP